MAKRLPLVDGSGNVVNIVTFADDFTATTWDGRTVVHHANAREASIGDTWIGTTLTKRVDTPVVTRAQQLRAIALSRNFTEAEAREYVTLLARGQGA